MNAFELSGIDHVAISVRDVRTSADWYQRVLGLKRVHQDAWGDFPAVVGIGSTAIALFPVGTHTVHRPQQRGTLTMRHIAFRADARNFSSAQSELAKQRISFTFQDHGISHSIYFSDPDGHEIEITTYELTETTL